MYSLSSHRWEGDNQVFITTEPISLMDFLISQPDESCGAVASFVGIVRDHHAGHKVKKLYYDRYPSMADQEIGLIVDQVKKEHGVNEIKVLHRIGWLEVGEAAVVIAVTATHRSEAFSACKAVIDQIKERVPIWKKEVYVDGTSEWVSCSHPAQVIYEEQPH